MDSTCHMLSTTHLPVSMYELVGCFGFNGPLSQYFSLYWAVSQRGRKKREKTDERKNVKTTPTRTYCKCNRPLPYYYPNVKLSLIYLSGKSALPMEMIETYPFWTRSTCHTP